MYYHISENVRISAYNEELIVLNLVKDEYLVLSSDLAEKLRIIVKKDCGKGTNGELDHFIKQFVNEGILESSVSYTPDPKKCDLYPVFKTGAPNIDWKVNTDGLGYKVKLTDFLITYKVLCKVFLVSYFSSFKKLVGLVKIKCDISDFKIPTFEEEKELVNILSATCLFFPVRVKCLEWSTTYTILAHKRKWRCNLEIGAQNLPFKAHAWAKTRNGIIDDYTDLPDMLSVLCSYPFKEDDL